MVRLYKDPSGDKIFSKATTSVTGLGLASNRAGKVLELEGRVKELENKISMVNISP